MFLTLYRLSIVNPNIHFYKAIENDSFKILICLLLAYRNTVNFSILNLYPSILLNSLISSDTFLVDLIRFSSQTKGC